MVWHLLQFPKLETAYSHLNPYIRVHKSVFALLVLQDVSIGLGCMIIRHCFHTEKLYEL